MSCRFVKLLGPRRATAGAVRRVVITLTVLGSSVAVVGSADAAVLVSTNAGGNLLRARPPAIHLVSNENLANLHWRSWGGRVARATGVDHASNPDPMRLASGRVRVELLGLRRCGGLAVYTTVRVRYLQGPPYAGAPNPVTFSYGCPVLTIDCPDFESREGEASYAWTGVRAHLVACEEAESILAAFFSSEAKPLPNAAEGDLVRGWRCRTGPAVGSGAGTPATCEHGQAKVSAYWH